MKRILYTMLASFLLVLALSGSASATETAGGGSSLAVGVNTELPPNISRGELYQPYEPHGIRYDEETDRLYLGDELVKKLYDPELDLIYDVPEGTLYLMATYTNGELTGVAETDEETINAVIAKSGTSELTGRTPEELQADLDDLMAEKEQLIKSGRMTQEEFDDVTSAIEDYLRDLDGYGE